MEVYNKDTNSPITILYRSAIFTYFTIAVRYYFSPSVITGLWRRRTVGATGRPISGPEM